MYACDLAWSLGFDLPPLETIAPKTFRVVCMFILLINYLFLLYSISVRNVYVWILDKLKNCLSSAAVKD